LSAFEVQLQEFSLHQDHQRPHSETGVPPHARWMAGGFLPRLPESLEQRDLLGRTGAKRRKVRHDGMHCQGWCDLAPMLAASVGEPVIIRYAPRDMAEIRVLHQHRFLCRAICAALAGDTMTLREIIQARNHRRKALRHTLQERARTVEALVDAHRGHHPADEPSRINDPAVSREQDTAREDTPTRKRYHQASRAG
jgi:putative transposase